MSVPPGTEMFQFPGFASKPYVFRPRYPRKGGFPHSDIRGSTIARISPRLFAACHVLHRLLAPRHPPNALITLSSRQHRPHAGPNRAPQTSDRAIPTLTHTLYQRLPTNPSSPVKEHPPSQGTPSGDPTPDGGLGSAHHSNPPGPTHPTATLQGAAAPADRAMSLDPPRTCSMSPGRCQTGWRQPDSNR
jgi:hypothetical protein